MKIPIQNIYFLLCYSWDSLQQKSLIDIAPQDFSGSENLFSKVLSSGVNQLFRQGVSQDYKSLTEVIPGVKGKLELTQTLKAGVLTHGKTICSFDDLSVNILSNQILKSTLEQLLKTDGTSRQNREELGFTLRRMDPIQSIKLQRRHFSQVRFHKNNQLYRFLLNVCELIFETLAPSEEQGRFRMRDFLREDKQMAALFEKFVRNFYRREQKKYTVGREDILWQWEGDSTSKALLPKMQTDINLLSSDEKIIIDAKFYSQTLTEHYEKERVHSANLYQLYAYLKNLKPDDPHRETARGILLYPVVTKEVSASFTFEKHRIEIRTIDLSRNWEEIHKYLLEIIGITFSGSAK